MGVSHSGSQLRRNKLQKMLFMRGDGGEERGGEASGGLKSWRLLRTADKARID